MLALSSLDPRSVPKEALAAITALEVAGFETWIVGGFVRDSLLGCPPADVDLASRAPWPLAKEVFARQGWETRDSGVKHGTLTVVVDGKAFEVTTFRSDGVYKDARHPSEVTFLDSIEEDLARRDFTVNALAYHPDRGLCDPFGGLDDLRRGVIRAVGDPARRFSEDALRIVRGCRFVAQLGFSLDEPTLRAMCLHKGLLGRVAIERISHELRLLLLAPHAGKALRETVDVLSAVLPELVAAKGFDQRSPYHIYDVLEHTARVVDGVPASEVVRWAALFHDLGKPTVFFLDERGQGHFYGHGEVGAAIARGALSRLGFSQAFIRQVSCLVAHHDDQVEPTRKSVKRMIAALDGDIELTRALFDLKRSDMLAHAPAYAGKAAAIDGLCEVLDAIVAEGEAFSVRHLAIGGREVMALGVPQGPLVGRALEAAFEAVVEEQVANEADALTEFLVAWLAKTPPKG